MARGHIREGEWPGGHIWEGEWPGDTQRRGSGQGTHKGGGVANLMVYDGLGHLPPGLGRSSDE